ncbi:serine hydrolase domain-containing protein [Ulvibacter antarcticus]|uniref:CubicO group peptidase (Beta-lactamase class C family) n=1 Tax=Ulvibacter antarcticus TaxID=442714 RepID=A0A3L9YGI2_9FLAO|nr:serine hydrolase domain-containing protein [Ulvibacter antarcticus]RMA58550.1 CubicO group peptidase (beta-lactamase class C family) [Ulvibacter antarcticus]
MIRYCLILIIILFISCNKEEGTAQETPPQPSMYFPPLSGNVWETTTPESLNWNISEADTLYDYLETRGTRAFIILKDGKIVIEKYWGNDIQNTSPFTQDSNWYWASAGKTLTALLVGIAQEEGILNINNKTSDYLGLNWTSLPSEKEELILIKHQLTMTTGLNYDVASLDCTDSSCLEYGTDAGQQWYYHNAPYTLLEQVVSNASGMTYNNFTDEKVENKIGMSGSWVTLGYNNVYWSTPRDAARYGLLLLNNGVWDETTVLADTSYVDAMTNSSQALNPSYGYLTWLNGKSSIRLPGFNLSFNTSLSLNAPSDMYAAMGKNGQFINVVPSENMVVIRMGEAPDNDLVPIEFHDEMWGLINNLTN